MKFVLFYHAFASCWNHGNAHFLRGVARELVRRGHAVVVYEPEDGWSRRNAIEDGGAAALDEAARLAPGADIRPYRLETLDFDRATDGADVVLVHEWNEPRLVSRLGRLRAGGARFRLLFHDTHHRAVTAPQELARFDLDGYDAVLAFGAVLRDVYVRRGWARRAFIWHEAADTALFRPLPDIARDTDVIWIGNWGDDERSEELDRFLFQPVRRLGLRARIHGVRYPEAARERLARLRIPYLGWLPNHRVPRAFAAARFTVHIPRRPYTRALPGIPTIRMFEAMACGIPLVVAPWHDVEKLFPPDSYLRAADDKQMTAALARLVRDAELAAALAASGLRTIRERHSCAHRVRELEMIIASLRGAEFGSAPSRHIATEQVLP